MDIKEIANEVRLLRQEIGVAKHSSAVVAEALTELIPAIDLLKSGITSNKVIAAALVTAAVNRLGALGVYTDGIAGGHRSLGGPRQLEIGQPVQTDLSLGASGGRRADLAASAGITCANDPTAGDQRMYTLGKRERQTLEAVAGYKRTWIHTSTLRARGCSPGASIRRLLNGLCMKGYIRFDGGDKWALTAAGLDRVLERRPDLETQRQWVIK